MPEGWGGLSAEDETRSKDDEIDHLRNEVARLMSLVEELNGLLLTHEICAERIKRRNRNNE